MPSGELKIQHGESVKNFSDVWKCGQTLSWVLNDIQSHDFLIKTKTTEKIHVEE